MTNRLYPPDYCNASTMAYLLSMGESTFRSYVMQELLPQPVQIGGKALWNRMEVHEALAKVGQPSTDSKTPDEIREAFSGKKKNERRNAA